MSDAAMSNQLQLLDLHLRQSTPLFGLLLAKVQHYQYFLQSNFGKTDAAFAEISQSEMLLNHSGPYM
jgi:hypothetical protein